MAGAYAALVSLMHTIEHIEHHPHPPITIDKDQVQSLTEKVSFLQDFLEAHNFHGGNQRVQGLQSQIVDAAYAVEDVIESHIVNQIHAQTTDSYGGRGKVTSTHFYHDLQKLIEDMDLIRKEVMEINDKTRVQDQLQRVITTPAVSSESPPTKQQTMVGSDDVLQEVLDNLTGQQSHRQIIPIVGMGGIGKTSLAKKAFENSLIVEHFDTRTWVTISQEYSVKEIILEILCQETKGSKEALSEKRQEDLGLQLYKSLSCRRYLIVMDDMWSIEAWDKIKFYFPDNSNGSRIIITTRISKLASNLPESYVVEMQFLDQDKSWSLLCKTVFGEDACPPELEHIGMKIAQNCKGLPLSIVVIGGLLAKSKQTREYWEHIAKNLNTIVHLEENERCLKVLHTSYEELPIHLKPCFLYMATFPEDSEIRISQLIKLWVAEGFLKPMRGKTLEEGSKEYLMDLIDRNLILVRKRGRLGTIKFCGIHDLLRDLCLREAHEEKFLCVTSQHSLNILRDGIKTQRRIAIHQSRLKKDYLHSLKSAPLTRSLIFCFEGDLPLVKFKLLRVLETIEKELYGQAQKYSLEDVFQLCNSRYLGINGGCDVKCEFPSTFSLLWNLQTLIVKGQYRLGAIAPPEIWKMPQLRHVDFGGLWGGIYIPDPPSGDMGKRDDLVLENLQTLMRIYDFKCSEEVVKRIPNVKKLKISYEDFEEGFEAASHYCLNNLGRLHKLESLGCFFPGNKTCRSDLVQNLTFPHSLRKLTLIGTNLNWEDMSTMIGSLPLLQVLILRRWAFIGPTWETVEGQFLSLKYLLIDGYSNLEYWITESSHFPCLVHLNLQGLYNLREIPSDIGEILTLQSIFVAYCGDSVVTSAKEILEQQEELGNEGLHVTVYISKMNDRNLRSLASRNFEVTRTW